MERKRSLTPGPDRVIRTKRIDTPCSLNYHPPWKKDARWRQSGGRRKWDEIHFNFGLHDLKHSKDGKLDLAGPQVTPVELYEKNLRELTTRMLATGARVIDATTTPVPEGSTGRVHRDELADNEAARRVMQELKVPIDDLHAAVPPYSTSFSGLKMCTSLRRGTRCWRSRWRRRWRRR